MSCRRALTAPFIVTTVASALACGSNVTTFSSSGSGDDGGSGGSEATSGATATAGTGTSAVTSGAGGASGVTTAVTTATSGTGGTGGEDTIHCPDHPPVGWEICEGIGQCVYDIACQSGPLTLAFQCTDYGGWEVDSDSCRRPYDSCPGTQLYCDGVWWVPQGTNPPSPCPSPPPETGAECFVGGFGGVWEHCGYPCEDGGWTIATCETGEDPFTGAWVYDEGCEP